MRHSLNSSPINPLPMAVWLLTLPIILGELVFLLGKTGMIGGAQGIGLRLTAMQATWYTPEILQQIWLRGTVAWDQLYRLISFSFVQTSLTHALFVVVFTLALGNMVAREFRPWAVVALYIGSAIGGALVYTLVVSLLPILPGPIVGGYPAVYGLVGAFTFLLWTRLAAVHENRFRAFTLIGILLVFQLVFGLVYGGVGYGWIAELAGFFAGFGLSFLLIDGGFARALRHIRDR